MNRCNPIDSTASQAVRAKYEQPATCLQGKGVVVDEGRVEAASDVRQSDNRTTGQQQSTGPLLDFFFGTSLSLGNCCLAA